MNWTAVGLSDLGRHRSRNEDSFLVRPVERIFGVADGMGGHAAGDVASRIAISVLAAAFEHPASARANAETMTRRLLDTFAVANGAILDHAAAHPETGGMGTTLTVLAPLATAECAIAHIGDSRAYRLRSGSLTQLTNDHTWVQEQVDAGMLTRSQARHHPLGNVLSRVLGTAAGGPVDTFVVDVEAGDLFMLCSDGLTTMLDDPDLHEILARSSTLEQKARALIDAANAQGGDDNITMVLVEAGAA